MLEVDDVSVAIDGREILRSISLRVEEGECVSLVGSNGSGKTTLMRCIAGLVRPSMGKIRVDGAAAESVRAATVRGFVQDDPPLYDYLSVRENLDFVSGLWSVASERVLEGMRLFDLGSWERTLFRDLSLGTKKRAGILAATLHEPRLVLLDEPFNGLDTNSVEMLRGVMRRWKAEGRSLLVTSHDQHVVQDLVTDVISLPGRSDGG